MLAQRAREGLRKVAEGEDQTITGWLEYGAALNEGRRLHKSDELFGQWLVSSNLDKTHPGDQQAAMWAAKDTERFLETRLAYPSARTVRGLHAIYSTPLFAFP